MRHGKDQRDIALSVLTPAIATIWSQHDDLLLLQKFLPVQLSAIKDQSSCAPRVTLCHRLPSPRIYRVCPHFHLALEGAWTREQSSLAYPATL